MALDHACYFIQKQHFSEYWGSALPKYGNWPQFYTRFASHLCAPGFFFLMGMGMVFFFSSRKKKGRSDFSIVRDLIIRGALLVIIQMFIENPAWTLGWRSAFPGVFRSVGVVPGGGPAPFFLGVLFALGLSLILGSTCLKFPASVNLIISGSFLLFTQIMIQFAGFGTAELPFVANLLFLPGRGRFFHTLYPILPWLGVTLLGISFGQIYFVRKEKFTGKLIWIGLSCLVCFILIRLFIPFGNTYVPGRNLIEFITLTKYPPSLALLLLTLGLNFILFFFFEKVPQTQVQRILMTFGRSPLFFYVIHLWFYAALGMLFSKGATLIVVYLIWIGSLLPLGFLCRIYGRLKTNSPERSIIHYF